MPADDACPPFGDLLADACCPLLESSLFLQNSGYASFSLSLSFCLYFCIVLSLCISLCICSCISLSLSFVISISLFARSLCISVSHTLSLSSKYTSFSVSLCLLLSHCRSFCTLPSLSVCLPLYLNLSPWLATNKLDLKTWTRNQLPPRTAVVGRGRQNFIEELPNERSLVPPRDRQTSRDRQLDRGYLLCYLFDSSDDDDTRLATFECCQSHPPPPGRLSCPIGKQPKSWIPRRPTVALRPGQGQVDSHHRHLIAGRSGLKSSSRGTKCRIAAQYGIECSRRLLQ